MIDNLGICIIPHSALMGMALIFSLTCIMQTVIFGVKMVRLDRATKRLQLISEGGLLVLFVLNFAFSWALAKGYTAPYFGLGVFWVNVSPLFWLCIPLAGIHVVSAFSDKHPLLIADALFCLVNVPLFVDVQGMVWCCAYATCAAYFAGRSTFMLLQLWNDRHQHLSYFASIEALNNLPEGILVYDKQGNIALLNDTMRSCLSSLGLSTDLADAQVLAGTLWSRGQRLGTLDEHIGQCVRTAMPDGTFRLFVFEGIEAKGQPFRLIAALDITEEERLRQNLEETTRELQITQSELRKSLESVQEVAENDALLYLHSRVHDIIGQRLSILHRYLEDGDQSEESFAQIRPLLHSILDDLENDDANDSNAELYAITYAFSLINVNVEIQGTLPDNSLASAAFVQVIREACTNAVKHAQASTIWVMLEEDSAQYALTVSNDGESFSGELRQGKGLPGMARSVVSAGGQLSLQTEGAFTLHATIPRT